MDLADGKTQTTVGEESHILERVARIMASVRGTKPDYAHLAAELEPALPFDLFGIVLLRHDRKAVRVTVCQRSGESWVARYHQHPLTDSMVERFLHRAERGKGASEITLSDRVSGETFFVESFPEGMSGTPAECGDALCGHPHLRAALITPLIAGGNVLGTLELGSSNLNAYNDPSLQRLINAIARLLATAIEGAQVGGNVAIQDRQRQELKDVSTALTSAVDLPMILNRIVEGITNALHVDSAIVRYDRWQRRLLVEAQSGINAQALQQILDHQDMLSSQQIIGATLHYRQQRVSQDISQDEQYPLSQALYAALRVRSIYCYPLITGDYVYGALLLLSPEPGGFTPLKIDIFSLFAGQATVAIHNGLLLQSAQERRQFQEIIEQFERAYQQNVFSHQDAEDEQALLACLREATLNTFGINLASILHFIGDHLLTRSERHLQDILRSVSVSDLSDESRITEGLAYDNSYPDAPAFLARASDLEHIAPASSRPGTDVLVKAAEQALEHTDFLKEISAALMRALKIDETNPQAYSQLKRDLAEAWFIVRLDGTCVYLNRAAESFCGGIRGEASEWSLWPEGGQTLFSSFRPLSMSPHERLSLEEALSPLFPRIRQLKETINYLNEFVSDPVAEKQSDGDEGESIALPAYHRCAIAAEPLAGQSAISIHASSRGRGISVVKSESTETVSVQAGRARRISPPSMLLDSSPSDHHYQFVRYPLYNEYGQWFANALHVHNVTEQVRDEKNKSVLLASVSHDLRTPLTTIKMAVTGLLETQGVWDEEALREILQEIDGETDRLHTLVNALVDMSRIEMGALILDKEWCDIVELIHNTLARSRRMLGDFTIQTQMPSPLPLIYADYAQLERVLANLLENVTRHSPKNTVIRLLVDMLTQKSLPAGLPENVTRAVRVRVIDQGPGIPEEEHERIFRSFYSLDANGNGLGLAICRGIVEAHQGRIWVENSAEGGSCFVFVLPIAS